MKIIIRSSVFSLFILFLFSVTAVFSQIDEEDSEKEKFTDKIKLKLSLEGYYQFDFNEQNGADQSLAGYRFSHTENNTFGMNLLLLGASYEDKNVRANLSYLNGDYAIYNYAAEPTMFQNLFEANFGVKLKEGIWLDAGLMSSHIGMESALVQENLTLTRSLMADNSPYYSTGVRLNITPSEKLELNFLILNGWQNIAERNENKALGFQAVYKPSDKLTLNYSNYYGEGLNLPRNARHRFFNDFFVLYNPNEKLQLAAAFDFGVQDDINDDKQFADSWWAASVIARQQLTENTFIVGRYEQMDDRNFAASGVGRMSGYSLGFDFIPKSRVMLRSEIKYMTSEEERFINDGENQKSNVFWVTSLSVALY